MKLLLRSDFRDYYDHHFDILLKPEIHHVFHRTAKDRTSRLDLLDYMSGQMNLLTPTYGTVREVADKLRFSHEDKHLVVYTNPYAHRGDGKERVTLKSALKRYPNKDCSLYLKPDEGTKSYRLLSIGHSIRYLMSYESTHTWKSNVGDVDIELLENPPKITSHHYPMFAVDFVISGGIPYAIDFNSAPGLAGTPVESLIDPKTIVKEIKEWMIESMS